jgi:hypothetical protein
MTWLFSIATVAGLSVAWVLAQRIGLPGLVCGLAIGDIAVAAIWIPRIACRSIGQNYSRFLFQVFLRGILAAIPVVLAGGAAKHLLSAGPDLLRIIALSAVAGSFTLAALYTIWFHPEERRQVGTLARRLAHR